MNNKPTFTLAALLLEYAKAMGHKTAATLETADRMAIEFAYKKLANAKSNR